MKFNYKQLILRMVLGLVCVAFGILTLISTTMLYGTTQYPTNRTEYGSILLLIICTLFLWLMTIALLQLTFGINIFGFVTRAFRSRYLRFWRWPLLLFVLTGAIGGRQVFQLTEKGFLWKEWRFRTDQEYITAAEPILKNIMQNYPVTAEQKKEMNFSLYVDRGSYWEGDSFRGIAPVPLDARAGGKYVRIHVTPPPRCDHYMVELYVSHQLDKVIQTYSDFSGPRNEGPYTDPDCPRKNFQ